MFLQGLWHGLKVVSVGLYWLLTLGIVWAGFVLMGTRSGWGWGNIAFALALFAARGYSARWLKDGVSYVAACGVIGVYFIVAAALTGWKPA